MTVARRLGPGVCRRFAQASEAVNIVAAPPGQRQRRDGPTLRKEPTHDGTRALNDVSITLQAIFPRRTPPRAVMSGGPPPAFAELFQEHLHPRLTNLCIAQGRCVAAGVATYSEAHAAIYRYAHRYGAGLLPPARADDLVDWIASTLAEQVFHAEVEGEGWVSWLERHHIVGGRVPERPAGLFSQRVYVWPVRRAP